MTASDARRIIAAHPDEFDLGFDEGFDASGMTYDGDPESPRSQAYDLGRSLRIGMVTA